MYKFLFPLFLFSIELFGQEAEPMATDRPDQTECANIVPTGFFQMENGFVVENDNIDGLKTKETVFISSLLKYGITRRIELRLIIENSTFQTHKDSHFSEIKGFNPTQLGFKINLLNGKKLIPKTSLIMHSVMPKWASEMKKTTKFGYNFRFTMQHELSDKASLGYNIGSEFDGEIGQNNIIYTISTCRRLSEKVGAYVELFGEYSKISQAKHSFAGGFTFPFKNNFMVDVSASKGLSTSAPNNYIGIGLSFRFPR